MQIWKNEKLNLKSEAELRMILLVEGASDIRVIRATWNVLKCEQKQKLTANYS